VVITVGYFYGILRANYITTPIYFLFDAAVIGLFLSTLPRVITERSSGPERSLKIWVAFLILWPTILFFIPVQDYMVQLVGLRGNVFMIPFLLLGVALDKKDIYKIAMWLGCLNLIALGFAIAEYFIGVPRFFPPSPVTEIIYRSNDLVNYTAFRIPSTFSNSHAFAGTMVITIPILVGAWVQHFERRSHKYLLAAAIAAALIGVLMSAARVHFIVAGVLVLVIAFSIRRRFAHSIGWVLMIAGIAWLATGEERLQRFVTLGNTDEVISRFRNSVNMTFFELAYQYPLGTGLGAGGTSLPYFLLDRIKDRIVMEDEYARIVLEQGIIGLYLWTVFLIWLFTRPKAKQDEDPWFLGKRLALVAGLCYFGTGLIGTGLLTSIPLTCLLFLSLGWMLTIEKPEIVTTTTDRAIAVV